MNLTAKSDDNPRPFKRQKLVSSSPLTSSPAPASVSLAPLPPAVLLVSLPALLAHPPNHRFYVHSLCLSLDALRKCLGLHALPPDIECRAWTGLAEIGMKVIGGGFSQDKNYPWAKGIESEVEKAISKGSIIAQKHPSLRAYMLHLSLLQVELSQWQHKTKFARTQIRNILASFLPTDPLYLVYSAYLASITLFTTPSAPTSTHSPNAQDVYAALAAVRDLEALAGTHGHKPVALLAHVLRLRILIAAEHWEDIPDALERCEAVLGLSYSPAVTPRSRKSSEEPQKPEATFIAFEDPFEAAMVVHILMMAVVFFTHVGNAAEASPRLSHLHALLDSGALDKFPDGTVEIVLPNSPPLTIATTHPRVLFLLAFLVSSTAKRDAVGRKPKRKVFAIEGLAAWENNLTQEILFTPWAGMGDVEEVEQRLARIKADLLCELIAVSIMRSEFDTAEQNLDALIAHTRTYELFPRYAARIALHHAHLAHALGQSSRALQCYRAAAHHAERGSFVEIAARAGEVALQIGLRRGMRTASDELEDGDEDGDTMLEREMGMDVARACRGMGGALEAVGRILEACLTSEILRSKQHLKQALSVVTKAQDNHLRALVLALIASHYLHTAGDHALQMLQTCEQLVAGLGAPPTKPVKGQPAVAVGNAPLGLWVGQRFLELFKRAGKEARVQKQQETNVQLAKAVEELARCAMASQNCT
ncbi:hypothetical protein BKA93DRAFT_727071 [Sparassis latifolia]